MFCQIYRLRLEKYFIINLAIIIFHIAYQVSSSSSPLIPSTSVDNKYLSIPDFLVQLMNLPDMPDSSSTKLKTVAKELSAEERNPLKLSSRKMRKNGLEEENTKKIMQKRPICPYHFVYNERKNRIPRTLVEVKCLGKRPKKNIFGNRTPFSIHTQIECRPMHWNMRVLDCQKSAGNDEENANYECQEATERISLACVPIMKEIKKSKEEEKENEEENEDVDLIQVPAKAFNENEQKIMELK